MVRGVVLSGTARDTKLALSVGVAELVTGEGVDEWLRRADRPLFTASGTGRDRLVRARGIFR